jgi:hypothetical protein
MRTQVFLCELPVAARYDLCVCFLHLLNILLDNLLALVAKRICRVDMRLEVDVFEFLV